MMCTRVLFRARARRRALGLAVCAVSIVLGACGSKSPSTTEQPTVPAEQATVPAEQATVPASAPDAPIPERVSEAQVLASVQAAESIKELPAAITREMLISLANNDPSGWAIGHGCQPSRAGTSLPSLDPCTFGAKDFTHTMMLIGDSQAAMWQPTFDLIGKRLGWRVIILTKGNCGPAAFQYYLAEEKRAFTECDEWQKWRLDQINKIAPSVVVLTGHSGENTGPLQEFTPAVWQDGIARTIQSMPAGTQTVILGNQPYLTQFGPECLAKNMGNVQKCSDPVKKVVPRGLNDASAAAAAATGGHYVEVSPWFCLNVCPYVIADMDVYVGSGHVNKPYAAYLSGVMEEALRPAIEAAVPGGS